MGIEPGPIWWQLSTLTIELPGNNIDENNNYYIIMIKKHYGDELNSVFFFN